MIQLGCICVVVAAMCLQSPQAADDPRGLRPLIDRIAKGEDSDAAEATEELVDAVIAPLMKAIGSMERDAANKRDRPPGEQRRLLAAVQRLNSELSLRLYELDLPAGDARLLRQFARDNPELTVRLFSPDAARRLDAVGRIPLVRDGPAGILLGARIEDGDADVMVAALDAALKLRDAVVARRVRHFVEQVNMAIKGKWYGADEQDAVRMLAIATEKAITVLAASGDRDSVPAAAEAFGLLMRPEYWMTFECAAAARALGELGDERAAAVLLPHLEDPRTAEMRAVGAGQAVTQLVGDAVLLALLKIYKIEPRKLGLSEAGEGDHRLVGFADAASRAEAIQEFRGWYDRNASLPADRRTAIEATRSTTRPAATQPSAAQPPNPRAAPASGPGANP